MAGSSSKFKRLSIQICSEISSLEKSVSKLIESKKFGISFLGTNIGRHGNINILSASTIDSVHLFKIENNNINPLLADIIENKNIQKICYAGEEPYSLMRHQWNIKPSNMMDLRMGYHILLDSNNKETVLYRFEEIVKRFLFNEKKCPVEDEPHQIPPSRVNLETARIFGRQYQRKKKNNIDPNIKIIENSNIVNDSNNPWGEWPLSKSKLSQAVHQSVHLIPLSRQILKTLGDYDGETVTKRSHERYETFYNLNSNLSHISSKSDVKSSLRDIYIGSIIEGIIGMRFGDKMIIYLNLPANGVVLGLQNVKLFDDISLGETVTCQVKEISSHGDVITLERYDAKNLYFHPKYKRYVQLPSDETVEKILMSQEPHKRQYKEFSTRKLTSDRAYTYGPEPVEFFERKKDYRFLGQKLFKAGGRGTFKIRKRIPKPEYDDNETGMGRVKYEDI
eukprot:GHVL01043660.1.p2 GENE.GHVL01043660.1~~GHVL01043660.1.p2  ORF type:complete len:450 (+),score=127.49 GHVL01043660.1:47-1396(+)